MTDNSSQEPPKVLCVDDLADNLAVRSLLLRALGYRVLTATNPRDAISVLESNRDIDLVLLDYRFPDAQEDGEWLAREIRNRWRSIKLMMLSGYPDVPDSARDCVDSFFLKGGGPSEFRDALNQLLPVKRDIVNLAEAQERNLQLRKKSKQLITKARNKRSL